MPFVGQVMLADSDAGATPDSYARLDVAGTPAQVWVEFDWMAPQASLDAWLAASVVSPDFVEFLAPDNSFTGFFCLFHDGVQWTWAAGSSNGGSVLGDTVYRIQLHWNTTTNELTVTVNNIDQFTDTDALATLGKIRVGLITAGDGGLVYYDNAIISSVGTGGTDLLDNDFETTIVPDFTAAIGSVSLVDVPSAPGGVNPFDPFGQGRFYEAPPWRFVVTDLDSVILTWLDGLAFDRSIVFTRGEPTSIGCSVPADNPEVNIPADDTFPFVSEGDRLLYAFRREGGEEPWRIRAAGLIQQVRDNADSDVSITQLVAFDGRQLLRRRPVTIDNVGTLPSDDNGITYLATPGNEILIEQLNRMEAWLTGALSHAGLDWGQTGFYTGTIETTDPIASINFARGVSIGEMIDDLEQTGTLDVVIRAVWDPINRPGITGELSIYERAGSPKYDAVFGYDCWPRSLVGLDRLIDGVERVNDIQFYAGQGGPPVTPYEKAASISRYGRYFAQQFFPGQVSVPAVEAMAQRTLALLANGQRTYTLQPAAERAPIPFLEYDRDDTVRVCAKGAFREQLDEMLRVESMPIAIGDDQLERVNGLLVSGGYQAAEPVTPGAPGIDEPTEPITRIVDAYGVAVNIYLAPEDLEDYQIIRGGDSSVVIQPDGAGSTLNRFEIIDAGANPSVSWAIHALYLKALDLTAENIWASTSSHVTGECFSLRMAGAVLRNFHGEGSNHAHLISYFEEEQPDTTITVGTVLCEDGTGEFNGDTAIWLSVNSAATCEQDFTFRNLDVTGPGAWFVRVDHPVFNGTIVVDNCTLNGVPVTAAMCDVDPLKLTVIP